MKAEHTAHLVHMLGRAGVGSRPRRVPRETQPDLIEAAYASTLVGLVSEWRREIEPLLHEMPWMLSSVRRDDVPEYARVRSTISRAREVAYKQAVRVKDAARRSGREVTDFQKRQLDRQLRAGLGVEIPLADQKVPSKIERFIEGNVSDIETLGRETLDKVQRLVLDAFERGTRPEDLAAEIAARFEIAENKARMIAGNQLSKLSSQVRRDRHVEIGITTFKWVTRNDDKVRPAHAVKHGRIFPYEGSRAPSFFPGEEINCVPADEPVLLHSPAVKAFRRWHRGELTKIVTDSGKSLRVTANHPVLTARGWVPAHLVHVGDYLVEAPTKNLGTAEDDPQRLNATAEQVFGALSQLGVSHRVRGSAGWFHGDAVEHDVDVVEVDRFLLHRRMAKFAQAGEDDCLAFAAKFGFGVGSFAALDIGHDAPAGGIVSGDDQRIAFTSGEGGPPRDHGLAPIARFDSALVERASNHVARDPELQRDLLHADSISVHGDNLILRKVNDVVSAPWEGIVFNFETLTNWFTTHNLIIHNCRCLAVPVLDEIKGKAAELAGKGRRRIV